MPGCRWPGSCATAATPSPDGPDPDAPDPDGPDPDGPDPDGPDPDGPILMAASGRTAKRLAAGPTLLLAAEVSDEIADALLAYDPALRVRSDRFVFGNGVLLYGPVEVTAELGA